VHLPYARAAALAHRSFFAPNNWSSSMPALPLMSYITAFVTSGVTLAKLFNAVCFILCGGVIYHFAARWWGRLKGGAAALLFWSCPLALYEGTTALIDLQVTLYSAVAILALLEWAAGGADGYLWISACGLGLALGSKHQAAFWILPVTTVIVVATLRRSDGRLRALWRHLFGYFALVLMLDLPWLVRSWVYTGNPVFPLANGIFKSPYFTAAMESANWAMYANEGVGRSPAALLKLPWAVTFHPGPFRGTLGAVFLAGVLLAGIRALRGAQPSGTGGPDRAVVLRYGLLCSVLYFYTWALPAQEIRYLLPLAPLLAVLTSAGALGVRTAGGRVNFAGILLIIAGSLVALPPVYPRLIHEWTYWHSYQSPFPFLLGRQTAQEFLRRDVPSIYVYDYVNSRLGETDRVLLLNDAFQFYSRVPTLYSFTVEGEQILFQEDDAGLIRKLKESRITHVLLNYNGMAPLRGVEPRLGVYFFLDKAFQERYLRPVFSMNNVVLYEVRRS
jgi:4-amino-4-deoxy-L-arabinose transferase-like glycosyltransferase